MAAKDYVWGVKGANRVANQYKLTPARLKQIIKEETQKVLREVGPPLGPSRAEEYHKLALEYVKFKCLWRAEYSAGAKCKAASKDDQCIRIEKWLPRAYCRDAMAQAHFANLKAMKWDVGKYDQKEIEAVIAKGKKKLLKLRACVKSGECA